MKRILIFFTLIFLVTFSNADNYPTGANSLGMANSSVAIPSVWSVFHNQAALAYLQGFYGAVYYENRFDFQEFSVKSLALSMSTKPGTFGFNYTNFGYSKYSDNKIGIAYSMKIAKNISLGVQLDYFLIIQDAYYGNISAITGEIGLYAEPFENFHLGAHIFNPWRTKVSSYQDERLATIFRLGIAYDFSEKAKVSVETEKDFDKPVLIKFGVEYIPVDNFILRSGIGFSEKNVFPAFGIGYNLNKMSFSIAFESHPVLGFKTGFSLNYRFK